MDIKIQSNHSKSTYLILVGIFILLALLAVPLIYRSVAITVINHKDVVQLVLEEQKIKQGSSFQSQVVAAESTVVTSSSRGTVAEVFVRNGEFLPSEAPIILLENVDIELEVSSRVSRIEDLKTLRENQNQEKIREEVASEIKNLELTESIEKLQNELLGKRRLAEEGFLPKNFVKDIENEIARKKRLIDIEKKSNRKFVNIREKKLQALDVKLKRAQLDLETTLNKQNSLLVRSTIAGEISQMNFSRGQSVMEGTEIARISRTEQKYIEALVDEYYLNSLELGQTAQLPYKDKNFELELDYIDRTIEDGKFLVRWKSSKKLSDLGIGQGVFVDHELPGNKPVTAIKYSPYLTNIKDNELFVMGLNNIATKRKVKFGDRDEEYVEVSGGLDVGDIIILPKININDGIKKVRLSK